ncbi:N-alpha-acetyltransferase 40-like [Papaver somniferum]|uniref:N-alpha-acetyltransferase 40-like n=1 Tax=Papaver somniferum TaxID=3469 RepID=UPI000E6FF0AC|nr:N-alpha-acetyltransferase 40-like [Papaver somniferum]XP_026431302.1 N-alpha-acetyltransferase 40-like [Papaver somniferum]
MKRREVLEKKKSIDEIIKNANNPLKDHLNSLPSSYLHYNRNGLCVYLESGIGSNLSSFMKQYIQKLLKLNMEATYGPEEWIFEEKVKRKEMVAPDARYLFVRKTAGNDDAMQPLGDRFVGFVQYRFVLEEEMPVVYVYELQLEECVQGKGLGKFLMQLVERIAYENQMSAVMLTVQKANVVAMDFYMSKLRYVISSDSPSQMGFDESYEILYKAVDCEVKEKLGTML